MLQMSILPFIRKISMTISLRQKLITTLLLLYWPTIFILTHIPQVPSWVSQFTFSDKILHFFGYLILVFLFWFAINPNRKVSWRRAGVWWILLVTVVYGIADEWLQGWVMRDPDVMDFLADLTGAFTALILLSIFPFWPLFVALAATAIFVATNFMQTNSSGQVTVINALFHLSAYAFFSLLWTRYMYHFLPVRAPQYKWLIGALVIPIGLLAGVELFSAVAGNGFTAENIIISLVGIGAVVATIFLKALFVQRRT